MDIIKRILSVFFPQHCPYCGEIIPFGTYECSSCADSFPSVSYSIMLPDGGKCVSAFLYRDEYRMAILDMKFRGAVFNSESLGRMIARSVKENYNTENIDVVISVPMSSDRLKVRGFNQSELLAKIAAHELKLPCERLMSRNPGALVQHYLTHEQRLANNDMRFQVISPELIEGKRILLVDDIVTSGMTLVNCRKLLFENGAAEVLCVTAAATTKY